jgi:hypothetical protein
MDPTVTNPDSPTDAAALPTAAPASSMFLIGLEVCLWTLYVCAFIMVLVVVMMQ